MLENTLNLVNSWATALHSPKFIAVIQEDDITIIPVNIYKNNEKSHEIEQGIRTFCEHLESKQIGTNVYYNCTECGEVVEQDC